MDGGIKMSNQNKRNLDYNPSFIYKLHNVYKQVNDGKKRKFILKDISLSISSGEFCGIIGRSGAGKSTLLNILGGIDTISMGDFSFCSDDETSIQFNNDKISFRDKKNKNKPKKNHSRAMAFFRKKIGFVFQSFQLINHFSVFDNVATPLMIQGKGEDEIKNEVKSALYSVGFLQHKMHSEKLDEDSALVENQMAQLPKSLSGGEKQRVAIARAIVTKPTVILADEPTGSLDQKNEEIILNLLKDIHAKSGITIVLISHSIDIVNNYCSRIIEFDEGKIIRDHNLT